MRAVWQTHTRSVCVFFCQDESPHSEWCDSKGGFTCRITQGAVMSRPLISLTLQLAYWFKITWLGRISFENIEDSMLRGRKKQIKAALAQRRSSQAGLYVTQELYDMQWKIIILPHMKKRTLLFSICGSKFQLDMLPHRSKEKRKRDWRMWMCGAARSLTS